MSRPTFIINIWMSGEGNPKNYIIKTRSGRIDSLLEELRWMCDETKDPSKKCEMRRYLEGYAEFCGGEDQMRKNWTDSYIKRFDEEKE